MRPAWSVIVFTVLSGAGLGLLALAAPLELLGWIDRGLAFSAGLAGALLVALGLGSSTLHLANPRNAWRAFSQWRRSWLSREGVAALALQPLLLAWLAALWFGVDWTMRAVAGLALTLLAWAVLVCTGMIYACLKTVPRWRTPLTPLAYLALGHASGALVLLALAQALGRGAPVTGALSALALGLLALAALAKGAWYARARRADGRLTLPRALPLGAPKVALLDRGHTHGNFLTREFAYDAARAQLLIMRAAGLLLGLLLPAALILAAPALAAWAAAAGIAGLLAERWLFFAESGHVVRLYLGARRI